MSWIKLDTDFFENVKVDRLSANAKLMYINCIMWSGQRLTDGAIPEHLILRLSRQSRASRAADLVQELATNGLFEVTETGYQIHNYLEYQSSKAQAEQRKDAGAERQRRFKERTTEPKSNAVTDALVTRPEIEIETTPTELDKPPPKTAELFNAFFEFANGYEYVTGTKLPKSSRGRINSAVTEAAEADITAADVRERGQLYRETWPDVDRSPQALLKHWEGFSPQSVSEKGACSHRWSDGTDSWAKVESAGGDVTRCDQCRVEKLEAVFAPAKLAVVSE